jgi:hypothetical protein
MGFDALIEKVRQAETALEAQERRVGADWRQLRGSWRALWTPGRIVLAGLATGFMVGRAEPFKRAAGGGVLQLLTALSGMFASGSAQAAASEAGEAADAAQDAQAQQAQAPRMHDNTTAQAQDPYASTLSPEPPADAERRYREAGLP